MVKKANTFQNVLLCGIGKAIFVYNGRSSSKCIQNTGDLNNKWLKHCQFDFEYVTIKLLDVLGGYNYIGYIFNDFRSHCVYRIDCCCCVAVR